MPGLPFDESSGTVPTDPSGRVLGPDDEEQSCLYATGWLRRGPSGVISTNKGDAEQVVGALLEDWAAGRTCRTTDDSDTPTDLIEWLEAEGHGPVVDHAGWKRIDEEEQARARPEAPREKLVVPEELLSAAKG